MNTFSKYNIFSKIKDSDNYFIINLLSGSADILEPEEAAAFEKHQRLEHTDYIAKGYVVNEAEEKKVYKNAYLKFVSEREQDEVQLFFVPTYSCNFACTYCYQDEYNPTKKELNNEIIDAFFAYVKKHFANRRKYITIFGGEPLLDTPKQREHIEYFINKCKEFKIDLAFVTNGYTLAQYVPILASAPVREIQVTIDGTASIHNKRRYLKGGKETFDKITDGVDLCLKNNLNVNLRMVVDKENIEDLPELAKFAIEKGWTKSEYFKTQLGRNYELHHCQEQSDRLFSRISLYETIFNQIKLNPEILEFHKPAYSIAKFLSENGELPSPLFDSCPGGKTEWAFDYTGNIYSCTATVGKSGEELGTFYPTESIDNEKVELWEQRDVLSIEECKNCAVQLACGGGCGSVAKNKNGHLHTPDCRPVKELLEMGINLYFD